MGAEMDRENDESSEEGVVLEVDAVNEEQTEVAGEQDEARQAETNTDTTYKKKIHNHDGYPLEEQNSVVYQRLALQHKNV
ncbi:hypothetical protein WR25_22700 [Diploscapter pachys]|uniref:Uncharacterized protein n=1 Tax=Diploscapter pachys TaxID=2018661 RepID=A0A2A2M0V0_9BILA|nr:hypothetical protein WR25_22700 [Diploscapter pachys]